MDFVLIALTMISGAYTAGATMRASVAHNVGGCSKLTSTARNAIMLQMDMATLRGQRILNVAKNTKQKKYQEFILHSYFEVLSLFVQ